jgi:hypothetical protein
MTGSSAAAMSWARVTQASRSRMFLPGYWGASTSAPCWRHHACSRRARSACARACWGLGLGARVCVLGWGVRGVGGCGGELCVTRQSRLQMRMCLLSCACFHASAFMRQLSCVCCPSPAGGWVLASPPFPRLCTCPPRCPRWQSRPPSAWSQRADASMGVWAGVRRADASMGFWVWVCTSVRLGAHHGKCTRSICLGAHNGSMQASHTLGRTQWVDAGVACTGSPRGGTQGQPGIFAGSATESESREPSGKCVCIGWEVVGGWIWQP